MELSINHLDLVQGQPIDLSKRIHIYLNFRACLGQNLLKIETKIMLTQLLRNFRYYQNP